MTRLHQLMFLEVMNLQKHQLSVCLSKVRQTHLSEEEKVPIYTFIDIMETIEQKKNLTFLCFEKMAKTKKNVELLKLKLLII